MQKREEEHPEQSNNSQFTKRRERERESEKLFQFQVFRAIQEVEVCCRYDGGGGSKTLSNLLILSS
jgi:hypothetical protein